MANGQSNIETTTERGGSRLNDLLMERLKEEPNYVSDEGKVKKWVVAEEARNYSPTLIALLLKEEKLRDTFFVEVAGAMVFKMESFLQFVEQKNYLSDSYTRYSQKIGLQIGGRFMNQRNEVELVFPYKDCILEGGQTKEDQKRNEIFFNQTLAQDEITQLLEPKVLTNAARYDVDGEHEVESLYPNDNFLIKGNNLLVLSSLKKELYAKVKLIFIDPPYNTGNDGFGYNDRFNHSTWLTFMRNRLEVARQMLTEDGTLCMTIDHNELGYALLLMDEVFGKENLKNIITAKRGSVTGAKVINPGVVNLSDYVLIYSRNSSTWKPNRVFRAKGRDDRYNQFIVNYEEGYKNWTFEPLADAFAYSLQTTKEKLKRALGSRYEEKLNDFVIANADRVMQFATLDDKNISQAARDLKQRSIANPSTVYKMEREGKSTYYVSNGKLMLFVKDRLIEMDGVKSFSEPISDIWDDVLPNDLHNEGGVIFKKGKKPEKLLHRIMKLTTNEGDLVLDYHLGSGTTAAVALKCKRRFIAIEQMDYGENDSVQRLKNVIGYHIGNDIEYDTRGVSAETGWHGGGSFVYLELKRYNKQFIDDIEKAQNTEGLIDIWEKMKARAFFRFNVEMQKMDDDIEGFKKLTLEEQKQLLCSLLDMNQLYVNRSDMDDAEAGVTEEEKRITKAFYGED
ncbi:MAG: site-specific DNA-methyltransferase [Prevotella sp.]|nr:site-specific DNA-methyltransferase [Prevotella sp.]